MKQVECILRQWFAVSKMANGSTKQPLQVTLLLRMMMVIGISKKEGKMEMNKNLQQLRDADNEIDVSELSDDELKEYYTLTYNGSLDAIMEMHKRRM